jgi:hypothetical protein
VDDIDAVPRLLNPLRRKPGSVDDAHATTFQRRVQAGQIWIARACARRREDRDDRAGWLLPSLH